jgi:hypothetical protein
MKKKERALPRTPKTPFGRQRPAQEPSEGKPLLADKLAEAAALGSLEGFIDQELPDSEYARSLANMMLGMTGMLPQAAASSPPPSEGLSREQAEEQAQKASAGVREAAQAGDVRGLIEMLRQEHLKRSGGGTGPADEIPAQTTSVSDGLTSLEREVLDQIIALAREHKVSPDWIILRSLKLYIEEYRRTGRL